jgi:hypothetical protein
MGWGWDDLVGGVLTGGLYNVAKHGGEAIVDSTQTKDVPEIIKVGPDAGILGQQQSLASTLAQQAQGNGPSGAATMLKNQGQANAAGALGMAAAQRGTNTGLAMRNALNAGAAANQNAANTAATARVNEQLGAQGMLGSQLNTMQGQNLQGKMGSAQLNTNIAMGNQGNKNALIGAGIGAVGQVAGMAAGMAHGGQVAGSAPVAGDSPANDIVHTMLSPGEIVIPKSVAEHPGFKEALIAHVNKMSGDAKGFAKVLAARKGIK